jgi:hypothetical protein
MRLACTIFARLNNKLSIKAALQLPAKRRPIACREAFTGALEFGDLSLTDW